MEKSYTHISSINFRKKLEAILNKLSFVGSNSIEDIFRNGELQSYERSQMVFSEKRYNAFEYFQLEGISHRFNIDDSNQMVTTGFYCDETVLTPYFARTTHSRSIFSLQALTECIFLKVPIGVFDKLREDNDQIRSFGQRVVEREFIGHLNYEVLFRSFSAKDRLLYFRNEYPGLENKIPHTIIASFLGITPVSFSRLRSELSKAV